MKIVVEYSVFVATFVDYCIISLTSTILKRNAKFKLLVAGLGGGISLLSPLLSPFFQVHLLLLFFTLVLMTVLSFGYSGVKIFLKDMAVMVLSTFVFGGACKGLEELVGSFPLFIVCVVVAVVFTVARIVCKSIDRANKIRQFTYTLKIIDKGREIEEEGYLDSGNMLVDAVTKKPIILVNFDFFHRLYEEISYLSIITKTYDEKLIKNGHYQKINSPGGMKNILVFSVDELRIGEEKSFKEVMLGLSFSGFEKSFGKNVLLNCLCV